MLRVRFSNRKSVKLADVSVLKLSLGALKK